MKALIISDGRIGHQSQSEAFCILKGLKYEIILVSYKSKILKLLSYILDFVGIYIQIFNYQKPKLKNYDLIISAGSTTYYANKFFAKKFKAKNISMMYPKGFRDNFTIIFSTYHNQQKDKQSIIKLPVNINYLKKTNYYQPKAKSIGFIIGGNNKSFTMDESVVDLINLIKNKFKEYEFLITTSPRTPQKVQDALLHNDFDFFVNYSQDQINPIYDFLKHCEFVFITQDSVSMISESVSNLNASVVVIPLKKKDKYNKFENFINTLENENLIQIYKENIIFKKTKKLDLKEIISKVKL